MKNFTLLMMLIGFLSFPTFPTFPIERLPEGNIQLTSPMKNFPPVEKGFVRDDYEMAVFNVDTHKQEPGTHLIGPGDNYRYTFFTNPKYVNNPNVKLQSAMVGVHFIDKDWTENQGDAHSEWARVLFNGKPMTWFVPGMLVKSDYRKGDTPHSSELFEIEGECEAHSSCRYPAYVFDVTALEDEIKQGKLVIEVTNLRKDGTDHTQQSNAPFGDFILLRVGNHFVWSVEE
jgi:hypothetical protein